MEFTKDKLRVKIFATTEAMAQEAATDVAACIKELAHSGEVNIIFAAAPSQSAFLECLIAMKDIPWEKVNAFHMDEYIGLIEGAPQRFGCFLKRNLFDKVPFRQVFYIDSSRDADEECERYTALLEAHSVDIVCLGIGENGHIAFNDPHVADFNDSAMVKVVSLDDMCRRQQVHDKCFETLEDVPTHALTLTIPALLRAPYMYCIVPFRQKAEAVYRTLEEPVSESCPASVLRRKAGSILYLDTESASLLPL